MNDITFTEYDACYWGWNERDKREELKEKNPWFLIARNSEQQIVAFAHFKFDFDEEIAVLYCYEVCNTFNIFFRRKYRFIVSSLILLH